MTSEGHARYHLDRIHAVLVCVHRHAFVLVGWFKEGDEVRFVACDDQRGPYEIIDSPFNDLRAPWESLMIPLPAKAWLSAEAAELDACTSLIAAHDRPDDCPEFRDLGERFVNGRLSVRTLLMNIASYKTSMLAQGRDSKVVRLLRMTPMSRWVVVVEWQDRDLQAQSKQCVVGEFVYDGTSYAGDPRRSAVSCGEFSIVYSPDYDPTSVLPNENPKSVSPEDDPTSDFVITSSNDSWESHLEHLLHGP